MKLSVAYLPAIRNSASAYRLLDESGQEVDWANRFLIAVDPTFARSSASKRTLHRYMSSWIASRSDTSKVIVVVAMWSLPFCG